MLDRRDFVSVGILAVAAATLGAPAHAVDAAAAAARLVAATGGAAAWARVGGLGIAARHHVVEHPQPHPNQLYIAMDEPRMRFEARGAGLDRVRAVVGSSGWRSSDGAAPVAMTPEQVTSDLRWWEAHVYRNIRRLALGDPSLTLKLHADGRLEVYRPDGTRLMWYRLNPQGEPIAFGAFDREQGTVLGPLQAVEGGIRLPIFSASHDGTFRAVDLRPTVYAAAPPVDYDRP